MKAHRYQHPDRHLEQDMGTPDMNDQGSPENGYSNDFANPSTLEVDVGRSMPPSQAATLPTLHTEVQALTTASGHDSGASRSMVAEGMHFVGNAWLRSPCSVAGLVEGNLTQADGVEVSVVVTETGHVKGDITAQKISVMGRTEGILDSGQGEVALHDTASVHGLVRYGRIQVNGADLNATLERVAPQKTGA
ncbi:polymer-forming cytoskeletal protein [Hydrogenophaga sp.]|mgnify:CR=1 FL=1|uniref:bactofilin family protein n=1 Tax=Hydrogenophaga sp. TaxID=1904254 RepID=UPI00286DAA99|nr:polymer-forming cytoskeletal protein [Hydrogenophaga sp.]